MTEAVRDIRNEPLLPNETIVTHLISFLEANAQESMQIIAPVNHLPNDNYHFQLITAGPRDCLVYNKVSEAVFKQGLTDFENMMHIITDSVGPTSEIIEDATKWRQMQEQRLQNAEIKAAPKLTSIIARLAQMKTEVWKAHDPEHRGQLPSEPIVQDLP